jgi:pSer/pThr/pTyr-binding forkhead associated (FHA) protein
LATGQVHDLPARCTIGRAEDNALVLTERWVSRHHCIIKRGLFGGWSMVQLGQKSSGPGVSAYTTVRHEGQVMVLKPGDKYRLSAGDTLSFGKARGDETIVFSHEFRLV